MTGPLSKPPNWFSFVRCILASHHLLLMYAEGMADRSVSLVGVKSFPCFLFFVSAFVVFSPCAPLCLCRCLYVMFFSICARTSAYCSGIPATVNVLPLSLWVVFQLIFQPNSQILSSFVSVRLLVYDSFAIGESSQSAFNKRNPTSSFLLLLLAIHAAYI